MVSNPISDIGLVAWGLKLGKDVFFSSPNINPDTAEIIRTLEDARGIINMPHPGEQFYSLEFTDNYKVYTVYHTAIDWSNRNNAYLAISLFVPNKIFFKDGVLVVLDALINIYHQERYIDDSYRISKRREKPELFLEELKKYHCYHYDGHLQRPNDDSKTSYVHVRYRDKRQLAAFFQNPFLPDYAGYKEVFFLPSGKEKLSPVKGIGAPLTIEPRPLYRSIRFILQDDKGKPLTSPLTCLVNNEPFHNSDSFEYIVKEATGHNSLSLNVRKEGYESISEKISLQGPELKNDEYLVQLKEKQTAVVRLIEPADGDGVANARVKAKRTNEIHPSSFISDVRGDVKLEGYYLGEKLEITVHADGYNTFNSTFILNSEPAYISLQQKKKEAVIPPGNPAIASPDPDASTSKADPPARENKKDVSPSTSATSPIKITPKQPQKIGNTPADARNAAEGEHSTNLKSIITGVAITVFFIVIIFFGVTHYIKKEKLGEARKELKSMLEQNSESIKIEIQGLIQQINSLDTTGISEDRQSYTQFNILKENAGNLPAVITADSSRWMQNINTLAQDSLKGTIRQQMLGKLEEYDESIKDWEDEFEILEKKLVENRTSIDEQRQVEKQRETRREELKRLSRLCNYSTDQAKRYRDEVASNEIQFSASERGLLMAKFQAVHDMLNYNYQGKKGGAELSIQQLYEEKLKSLKQERWNILSETQRAWLDTAINDYWN